MRIKNTHVQAWVDISYKLLLQNASIFDYNRLWDSFCKRAYYNSIEERDELSKLCRQEWQKRGYPDGITTFAFVDFRPKSNKG